ncbi:MAG: hypothetical protein ACOYNF_16040 [Rhodoferax sp.]
MEDFAALRYLHDQAQALHLGAPIAQSADPKDLYQLVRPACRRPTLAYATGITY